jgi:hypothetical protein
MVCRQIYTDTAFLPLQLNPVHVTDFDAWTHFTSSLSEEQRNAIRMVEMAFCQLSTIQAFPHGEPGMSGPLAELGGGLKKITVLKTCRMKEARILGDLEMWSSAAKTFCGYNEVKIEFARSSGERRHEL